MSDDQDVVMSDAQPTQETQPPSQVPVDTDEVVTEDDPWAKQHDNLIVSYIDVFGRVSHFIMLVILCS